MGRGGDAEATQPRHARKHSPRHAAVILVRDSEPVRSREREPADVDALNDAPTIGEVIRVLLRHPVKLVLLRWNWKSAITSAVIRAVLFFSVNLQSGWDAAFDALRTEFFFRLIASGFYGTLTQAFSRVRPEGTATLFAMVVLPAASHSLELLVHWQRGTARLASSLLSSIILTVVSTAFNVFAMRRGVMVVGPGSSSLLSDFRRIPALIVAFVASAAMAFVRTLHGQARARAE